jgi:hypothetical protein
MTGWTTGQRGAAVKATGELKFVRLEGSRVRLFCLKNKQVKVKAVLCVAN